MSNNNTPDFNNQNANEFANILNQINPLISRLTGQVKDFNRQLADSAKNAQQLEREFEDTFRSSYQGFESLTQQLRRIDKEYKDLDRSIADLIKQQEKLKQASESANQAEQAALQQEIKQLDEVIRKRAQSRDQIDEERVALEDLSKKFGFYISEVQKAAKQQEELERFTSRYGTQIKAAGEGVSTFARNLASAAGFALSFDAVMQKALSGFGRIKEVNRDFVALQANLANAGRVDLTKITGGQLESQSKRYREDALRLVSDFGISFEEASKRIQSISSIRPTGGMSKENWQAASTGLAELAGKLEITTGLSTEVSRALIKQDIQGYGRDTREASSSLLQASMAMKSLNMDTQEANSLLSNLSSSTAIYNTDVRSLTTTLKNLNDMQLKANSAQQQAVAGYFGQGLAGQGFGDQLKTLQMIQRSGLSKELGITGKTTEEQYAQLLEANQKNAQGVAAASLLGYSRSVGFSNTTGGQAAFRLGATGTSMGLSQDQVTAFQGILLQNKGKNIEDIARGMMKPEPTEKEIQGQASMIESAFASFQKLFVNPFDVSKQKQEIGIGEMFSGPLQALGNIASQIPVQMGIVIGLLANISLNTGLLGKLSIFGGPGLFNKGIIGSTTGKLLGETGMLTKFTGPLSKLEGLTAPLLKIGGTIGKVLPGLGIALSAFGAFDNISSGLKEGGFKGLLTSIGIRGKGGFEGALQGAGSLAATGTLVGAGVGALFGGVGALPGAAIGGLAGTILGAIGGAFDMESMGSKIADGLDSWWKSASSWLFNNLSNPITNLLDAFVTPAKQFFQWVLGINATITNFLKNPMGSISNAISGGAGGGFMQSALNTAQGAWNTVSGWFSGGRGTEAASNAVTYAKSQVGVSETSGAYEKYAQGKVQAWCADFVSTVFEKAGVNEKHTSSVAELYKSAKASGKLTNQAQAGFAVLYGNAQKGEFKHTGIVESVNPNGTLNTIEGNWGNKVSRRLIDPNKESIIGYVNPYGNMSKSTNTPGASTKENYMRIAEAAANKYGLNSNVFKRLIEAESQWNPNAKSKAGALGLTQLMPATAKELGVNPLNPSESIEGGAKYLSQQLSTFGGDYTKAVAAYNAGAGNVKKFGGVPPFKETQNYVQKILGNQLASAGGSNPTIVQNFYGPADPDKVKNAAKAALQERQMKKGAVQVKSAPRSTPLA